MSNPIVRVAAALTACLMLLPFVGCKSGGPVDCCTTDANGVTTEGGGFTLRGGEEQTIYYPKAYATRPNLEVTSDNNRCQVLDQKEDSFLVRNTSTQPTQVTWKARGNKRQAVVVAPPPPTPAPVRVIGAPPPPVPVYIGR